MTDPARNRFFVMSLTRLIGALLIGAGLVAANGRLADVPRAAGIVIALIGVFGFAVAPKLLARRWRSPQ